jgi:sodium-dependent dicarboxylate transporter 2/3/5
LGPISRPEWKILVIMGTMVTLWILSTWYPAIDIYLVALAGACMMFFPGINLFTWKEVQNNTGWDVLLMSGGVTSLGIASSRSGFAKWVVDSSLTGLHDLDLVWILAVIGVFTVIVHVMLPASPAIIAVIVPPMILLARDSGVNPAIYGLPVIFTTSCAFLLPLDPVALITYSKGYYRIFDMFVPGLIISVFWVIVMTALLMTLGSVVGIG